LFYITIVTIVFLKFTSTTIVTGSSKDAQVADQHVPPIFNTPLPQFIWSNTNYLEKMWIDLDFLNENIFLKKVSPNLEITHNPLLLNTKNLHRNIIDLRDRFPTGVNGSLVLSSLKGDTEQVKQRLTMSSNDTRCIRKCINFLVNLLFI
jgi:hypothetical protein